MVGAANIINMALLALSMLLLATSTRTLSLSLYPLLVSPSTVPIDEILCPAPSIIADYRNDRLPNPFQFNDGSPVLDQISWACKRQQIRAIVQGYEAGYLPPRPPVVLSSFSRSVNSSQGTLIVISGLNRNHNVSFSSSIKYPTGVPPKHGWPLLIAYGGPSIPVPDRIAVLTYDNSAIGKQDSNPASRGLGRFFDLYGHNATASAMTAWVWGVSRIIDSLEQTPEAGINVGRIAVTGCSRNGKGALMAGAFDQRIALTIPQESGSGGDTCWRLSKYEQDSGGVVQEATEIVQENVWFSANFDSYVHNITSLPYDHHELMSMVAPRGLISYGNTDYEWLSPLSAWGCTTAAHAVYQALGVPDHHGFVQVGNHSHCSFPASLNSTLFPFFHKFLLDDETANTTIFQTNGLFNGTLWDSSYWLNWTIPTFPTIGF